MPRCSNSYFACSDYKMRFQHVLYIKRILYHQYYCKYIGITRGLLHNNLPTNNISELTSHRILFHNFTPLRQIG